MVRVGRKVQRAPGCWKSWVGAQGAVVILVTAERKCYSRSGFFRCLSPYQWSEALDVARPPRGVAGISGFKWCRDGIYVVATLELGDRRSGVRLEGDSPMAEESR